MRAFAALAALVAVLAPAAHVVATGVCYSPFHNERYFSQPKAIADVLAADMAQIAKATNFSAVRTYHAQFYGENVVNAARASGLQVAIGIQMVGEGGAPYAYLANDIQAAVEAATTHPESVQAIYAGNENLQNGDFGASSADDIIAVIQRVKRALAGTKGAHVPVGTVQRLEEWLHASGADRVAAASDIVGVNIYPFFTPGGERNMVETLAAQWALATAKFGDKARLTETGWPSHGSISSAGNAPTVANAAKYFGAFAQWAAASPQTRDAFYFMMYDLLSAHATDYEQHFGIATAAGQLKFAVSDVAKAAAGSSASTTAAPLAPVVTKTAGKSTAKATAGSAADAASSEVAGESDRSIDSTSTTTTAPATAWPVKTTAPASTVAAGSSAIGNAASTAATTNNSARSNTLKATAMSTNSSSTHTEASEPTAGFPAESASASPATTTPSPKSRAPHSASSAALDVSSGSKSSHHDVGSGSSQGSKDGSVGSASSAGTVPKTDPDVGDVTDSHKNAPVAVPDVVKTPTFAPVPSESSASKAKEKEIQAQEAQARQARIVAGQQGAAVQALTIGIGLAGVATIAVIAVYMQKRRNESENRVSITTLDARESTPSVYSDPLGTRFSSIVMITPNGDGVCIL